jgi:predicted Zn-dependent peptidase
MIRTFATLLLAATHATGALGQAPPGAAAAASAFAPDTVLAPSGGPRVVVLAAPEEGVAALRLSIPLRESGIEAGAGWLLRELGLDRMRTLARPVGAHVAASRTPWGIAYSVTGAAADFEYLAYLLREAVAAPDVDSPAFQSARALLLEAVAEGVETPAGRVASELRAQIAGEHPPVMGTPASVSGLDPARVRQVWLRSHQATGMSLVVSAPVIPEVVLAATRGMGAPEGSAGPPLDAPPPSPPRRVAPQALRTWYGEVWRGGSPADPQGLVLARLLTTHLRAQTSDFEVSVELWELPGHWAFAVVGAAYGRTVAPMRRTVSGALDGARASLDAAAVQRAVALERSDLLLRSRTPAGLVEEVGRAMDSADGDPWAAAHALESLERTDLATLRAFVDGILSAGSQKAEVRP